MMTAIFKSNVKRLRVFKTNEPDLYTASKFVVAYAWAWCAPPPMCNYVSKQRWQHASDWIVEQNPVSCIHNIYRNAMNQP